jgi:hypothetical protein
MFNINERFLRHIWRKQYLRPLDLVSTDGLQIVIESPGEPNNDAGPDFFNAKIRIDGTSLSGDVEIHSRSIDWTRHRHMNDERYNRVILHVVLYNDDGRAPRSKSGRILPVLCLERFLDDSFRAVWDRSITDDRAERSPVLACGSVHKDLTEDETAEWLSRLARERVELKIRRAEARMKELIDEHRMTVKEPRFRYFGNPEDIPAPSMEYSRQDFSSRWLWEQAFYEAIFESLGYSKNKEQFLKLARAIPILHIRETISLSSGDRSVALRGLMYGAAGFLSEDNHIPGLDDLFRPDVGMTMEQMKKMVSGWWQRNNTSYVRERFQVSSWIFFRLRPNNFPTRRLAAGVSIAERIMQREILQDLIMIFRQDPDTSRQQKSLYRYFRSPGSDPENCGKHTIELLGHSRITEIIVNAVIPLLLLYARIFKDIELRNSVWKYYGEIRAVVQFRLVRFMCRQIPALTPFAGYAFGQQAIIHLHNFGCEEKRCNECYLRKNNRRRCEATAESS